MSKGKKTKVSPVVIGILGEIPKDLVKHLNTTGATKITIELQKAAFLDTVYILQ